MFIPENTQVEFNPFTDFNTFFERISLDGEINVVFPQSAIKCSCSPDLIGLNKNGNIYYQIKKIER